MTEYDVKKIAHDYIKENLRVEIDTEAIMFSNDIRISVRTILEEDEIGRSSDTLRMPNTEE